METEEILEAFNLHYFYSIAIYGIFHPIHMLCNKQVNTLQVISIIYVHVKVWRPVAA